MTPLSASFRDQLASAAVREGLVDAVFTRLPSPVGRLLLIGGPEGICRIAFEEEPEGETLAEVAARLGPPHRRVPTPSSRGRGTRSRRTSRAPTWTSARFPST
jgi:hypothetical protein